MSCPHISLDRGSNALIIMFDYMQLQSSLCSREHNSRVLEAKMPFMFSIGKPIFNNNL